MPEGVTIAGVTKRFGMHHVLHGIDLAVEPGAFVCLLGPSGCGKTTLLRCVAGLEQPDEGRISVGSTAVLDTAKKLFVPPEKRRLGMVFQSYALWPHMTVEQNIGYPLKKHGVPKAERKRRIEGIARTVGLPDLLGRRPSQLSGGQQQRVALARALVYEPPVLLLDEPLSNLDATLRVQLRRELRHLHQALGTTTILVTHDQEEASALADVIALMHQGRIVQLGTAAEIFDRPRSRFVAEFVGFENLIQARVVGYEADRCVLALDPEIQISVPRPADCPPTNTTVLVAIRSDSLSLSPPGRLGTGGCVRRVTRLGRGVEYEVSVAGQVILVRTQDGLPEFEPGAKVSIAFDRCKSAIMDADPT